MAGSAVDWLVGNALPLPMFGNASALPMANLGSTGQALPLGGRLGGDTDALPLGNVGRYDVGALPVTFNTVAGLKKQREDWANAAEKRATGRQAQAVGQAAQGRGVPASVPAAFQPLVAAAAQKYGVDPALIAAMMAQESSGNPNAVSSAGAQGLMQVIPSTGAMYGVSDPAALRDPATSIDVGVHYFADLLKQYGGNVENALAAYNGGPRGVTAPVAETRQYVPAVMARYRAAQAAPPPAAVAPAVAPGGSVFPVVGYRGPIGPHWGGVLGGMDIMAAEGTPVVAMRGGTVTNTGYSPTAGGNWAEIRGDDGNLYYYAHMQGPAQVGAGQNVPAGTPLGFVGRTGNARNTPPHLHLGIGPNILQGTDATGGTGGNFNAVALLQAAYDAALAAAGAP